MLDEPTIDLHEAKQNGIVSAVNFAEVMTKVGDYEQAGRPILSRDLLEAVQVIPFTEQQAILAAELRRTTRHLGLSLGDRCCLALGISTGSPVYTADWAWTQLNLECEIRYIRPLST